MKAPCGSAENSHGTRFKIFGATFCENRQHARPHVCTHSSLFRDTVTVQPLERFLKLHILLREHLDVYATIATGASRSATHETWQYPGGPKMYEIISMMQMSFGELEPSQAPPRKQANL